MITSGARAVIEKREELSVGIDDGERLQQPLRVLVELQEPRTLNLRLQTRERAPLALRGVDRSRWRAAFIDR